jgi:hypothetical protein
MASRVILKPSVYRDGDRWVAELDHISWIDASDYDTWEAALNKALWLGLCAGVWSTNG